MTTIPSVFDVDKLVTDSAEPALVWEAMVAKAVEVRASDIHVLAQQDGSTLAFRLDGDLREQGSLSADFTRRLISHVKSIAGADISEHRRPTEGRLKISAVGRLVDMRISTVPSIHGQDLVVRVFDHEVGLFGLDELGLLQEQLRLVQDIISRPHGLVLVSGPTGSGKTTSLYAMLQHLTGGTRKIVTIEDPVEYDLTGVSQTQINTRVGVGFNVMLTALLRQDPDIIMVGEIRDQETAATAVRAANAGNLVLATTHATRASRAIETMLSLSVHPYFLAVALRGVIAQVLVKRVCTACKTALPETADMILDDAIRQRLPADCKAQLHEGTGCERCYHTGYHGRMGLFEVFAPDGTIKDLVVARRPAADIDRAAADSGMLSLEQVAKLAVVTGQTTLNELADNIPTL